MAAYYNEFDSKAAAWLRELIKKGHIADGVVDERSISDVKPSDLTGFDQCHFFAGIGGWSLALRLAGVPDSAQVWTGSCPCQPFSTAGKGGGFSDERHLWPHWQWLIQQCKPAVIFGEQVASKAVEPWIDLVHADMEAMGYAFGCVPFPSASVGAPHIRDRAYWVADAIRDEEQQEQQRPATDERGWCSDSLGGRGVDIGLAIPSIGGRERPWVSAERSEWIGEPLPAGGGEIVRELERNSARCGTQNTTHTRAAPTNSFWRDPDWLFCRDGKWRPVEPGTFPLAHGVPARVGRLRGYGNAINPFQAAEFIRAALITKEVL